VAYEVYNPGLREAMRELSWEVAAGVWPEAIARAAASGLWPGDEGAEGVIEAVVRERMKLARLAALRGGKHDGPGFVRRGRRFKSGHPDH
jgi:hypothetical protein